VSYGKATPYLPLVDLLKGYFKIADSDDTRAIRAKVTGNVLTLDEALKESVAPLLWVLESLPPEHEFLALEATVRRESALEAVKRVLLRESRSQPLLLVFEDLHWIDAETQALLDSLIESAPTASVLLAVNYRPEYSHGWGNKTYYRQLRVDPLAAESADALLEPLLGDDPGLHPLRRQLIERTEGNPLFLEESVRSLVETRVLVGERGAYRLGKDPTAIQVPATVQAILAARIDRLRPDDKQLLQGASVIGKVLPWALLLDTSELAEDDLRHGLARLQAAEFIYEAKLFPDLEYTFKHALTHEVTYGSLLQDRRRAIHGRIVSGIERVYANRLAEHVDRLAHHAFRSEMWDKAPPFRQTGSFASQPSIDAVVGGPKSPGNLWWRGAHDRAVALATWERAMAASFRDFATTITSNFRLGQAYHSLGEYPKAADALTRNVTMIVSDLRGETFGLAGLPAVFSRVWLALCLVEQGALDEAEAHAEEAVAIAEAENHPFSLIVACAGIGTSPRPPRELRERDRLERGLLTQHVAAIPLLFPTIAAPLGWAYALAGRHEEGINVLQDAIERAEALDFAANHALRLAWLAEAHRAAGHGDDAKRAGLRALEIARRHQERGHEAYALHQLGEAATKASPRDEEKGREYYRGALALAEALRMRPLVAMISSSLP
jgi:tetratricopeptide (TPR) repeat protein